MSSAILIQVSRELLLGVQKRDKDLTNYVMVIGHMLINSVHGYPIIAMLVLPRHTLMHPEMRVNGLHECVH
jgi:hypothetical protein